MNEGSIWISESDLVLNTRTLIQVTGVRAAAAELVEVDKVAKESGFYAKARPAYEERKIAEKILKLLEK
jgi:hypothetical protein